MPILRNTKHEHFAHLVAKGESAQKAYVLAGYSEQGAAQSAARLLRDAKICSRVAELQKSVNERVVEKMAYDLAAAMIEAEDALNLAKTVNNPGAAVAAITLRAKLSGLLIERKEVRTGPLDAASDDELDRIIRSAATEAQVSLGAPGEGSKTRH